MVREAARIPDARWRLAFRRAAVRADARSCAMRVVRGLTGWIVDVACCRTRQTANGGDCSSYRLLEVGAQQSRMAARMRPALCTGQ
ncbi:hypothetical protein DP42_5587 [Burkholderia pseudomallei]|nr:hypothetical protein DP42_5587 [Burkholderia pseudomallei]